VAASRKQAGQAFHAPSSMHPEPSRRTQCSHQRESWAVTYRPIPE
jgi:hypothetical protein